MHTTDQSKLIINVQLLQKPHFADFYYTEPMRVLHSFMFIFLIARLRLITQKGHTVIRRRHAEYWPVAHKRPPQILLGSLLYLNRETKQKS